MKMYSLGLSLAFLIWVGFLFHWFLIELIGG